MKNTFISLMMVVATLLAVLLPQSVYAAKDRAVCRVSTNDVGSFTGRGKTESEAFEDAAVQCFDSHMAISKMRKNNVQDEDAWLTIIDVCANLKCK
jgi:hypothetical protein